MQEQQVQQEVLQDPLLKQVITGLQKDPGSQLGFSMMHGILFYKDRLVLSAKSACIPILIRNFMPLLWEVFLVFYEPTEEWLEACIGLE